MVALWSRGLGADRLTCTQAAQPSLNQLMLLLYCKQGIDHQKLKSRQQSGVEHT